MPAQLPAQDREDLLDLLADLQHDLGKYIMLPLSFLPADAPPEALREALGRALRATRGGPDGPRRARELWADFVAEAPAALATSPEMARLTHVVEAALAWEDRLPPNGAPLDRAAVEADLGAVGAAIRELIDQLREG